MQDKARWLMIDLAIHVFQEAMERRIPIELGRKALAAMNQLEEDERLGEHGAVPEHERTQPPCGFCDGHGEFWTPTRATTCMKCKGTGIEPAEGEAQ